VTVAVLPATFDPITCGHVDIARRASKLFDRLVVGVASSRPSKNVMFSADERVAMVQESLEDLRVEVVAFEGLLVDLCKRLGATVVIRGLRAVSDFEYEYQQAFMNRQMLPGLEIVAMFPSVEYAFISSSLVKEIAENGGDVSGMVTRPVLKRLRHRFRTQPPLAERG
jgi:pantetheine-phosphate adenylyltransferase